MRRYLSERERLIATAAPGISSARRLALLTDEMLIGLAEESAATRLPDRTRWSLVALGGYGAGALLPASDLDLLLVSDAPASTVKPFVEALLYPLWDAGLTVGHQVRSRREQIAAVRGDLVTRTAALTGRVLAGDRTIGAGVLGACATDARKHSGAVLAALRERARPGSPYLLEPDLKEGAGGRRDLDELTWTAAVLTGATQPDPAALVDLGLLAGDEYARLHDAASTIAAARWELQRSDSGQLMAEEAAEELRTDPADVQRALADTHHLLERVRRRLRHRGWTGPYPAEDTPLHPSDLLDTVARGSGALGELEEAAWAGRIDHLVPGMRELMWLRRPGIAHTRTVGAHSLACAVLAAESLPAHPRVRDRDAVLVAALVHDRGKSEPGPGHAGRGADGAREAAGRFGLPPSSAEQVVSLVRHHLFLAETASRIDLDDPVAIAQAAGSLGDPDLLAPLHLLTVADSQATGPGAWSDWHDVLVGTLVSRLERAFASGPSTAPVAGSPASPAADPGAHPETGHRARHAAARYTGLLARVAADRTPGAHVLEVAPGPIPGSFEVRVAARDRPGLLATLAGTFALSGLDILGARSIETEPGLALDTFVVTSATLAPIEPHTWSRVERTLTAALIGRYAIGVRLAERLRHYSPRIEGALESRVEEDASGATLYVRAPDRTGLLYDIARAIADSGLDVRSLTSTSRAGWAEDTFRLSLASDPASGAGVLGQLAMRLRELR